MEAAIEAFHCAFGATLDQVEVEVDKKGVEERHNFMTVLGVRICNEKQQKLTLTKTLEKQDTLLEPNTSCPQNLESQRLPNQTRKSRL